MQGRTRMGDALGAMRAVGLGCAYLAAETATF
jgi:hypothetical protein